MTARLVRRVHVLRVLGLVTGALLAVDAVVHFSDAGLYDVANRAGITEGTLFRVQAAVAVAVALALLVRPHWVVWIAAVLVAAGAAGAAFLFTYVDVGALGPLPDLYEPTWSVPGKRVTTAAEIAATLVAVVGLIIALRARRNRDRPQQPPRLALQGSDASPSTGSGGDGEPGGHRGIHGYEPAPGGGTLRHTNRP